MDKLHHNAVLVSVHCTKWTHQIADEEASNKLAELVGGEAASFRASKDIGKHPVIKALDKLIGQVGNQVVRKLTLPWNESQKFLVVDLLEKFEGAIRSKNDLMDEYKRELRQVWPQIIEDAGRRLGDQFDERLYPDVEEVIEKYSIKYELDVLPNLSDARLSLGADKLEQVKDQVRKATEEKVQGITQAAHDRVLNVLTTLIDGLERHGKKAEGAKRASKFSDNTVDEVTALAEILPSLNVTGDPALVKASNAILSKLRNLDPEELRKNSTKREQAASQAKDIRKDLSDALSAFD